jgi:hypothetical protein
VFIGPPGSAIESMGNKRYVDVEMEEDGSVHMEEVGGVGIGYYSLMGFLGFGEITKEAEEVVMR